MKLTVFKKKKINLDKIKLIVLPLTVFSLTVVIALLIIRLTQETTLKTFKPTKTINIEEPFSGKLYFNDSLGSDDFLNLVVGGINKAKNKIELAMYSINSTEIRDALLEAATKGVQVDLVLSDKHKDVLEKFFNTEKDNFTIKFTGASADRTYMHHKFLIIDRGQNNQKLFFGSYNFTDIQGKFDPSFILETNREEVVDIFGEEFLRIKDDKLWQGKRSANYNPFAALINYPNGYLEIWFTPSTRQNSLIKKLQSLIKQAEQQVEVMIWQLTSKDIALSLLNISKKIKTTIITEDSSFYADNSMFPDMISWAKKQKLNKLLIIDDSPRNTEISQFNLSWALNSYLHHHMLMIDNEIVLFGTNNWSSGGFWNNDESVIISNIPFLVSGFKKSFDYNFKINHQDK